MRSIRIVIVGAMVCSAACGGKTDKGGAGGPQTYQLWTDRTKTTPAGGVTLHITWPADWKVLQTLADTVDVKPAGATGTFEVKMIVRPCPDGAVDAACIDSWRMSDNYDIDLANKVVNGRGWLTRKIGDQVDGSLFVFHPATKTVVQCRTLVSSENEDKLAIGRKACESLTF